jgi:hypothetical protein
VADHHIARIVDYTHCPWILSAASSVAIAEPVAEPLAEPFAEPFPEPL